MVSPPRMPKLNSDAVLRHFSALAEAVDIEIVVQDYPPISGYAMEPWLPRANRQEIPSARTIKLEDPPTPFKTSRILNEVEKIGGVEDVRILAGSAGCFLEELGRRNRRDDRLCLPRDSRADRQPLQVRPRAGRG